MSDSEYSSDDDEDYVPEPDSEEEEITQEKEASTKKSTQKGTTKRKRKGGIKLDDDESDDDDDQLSDQEDLDEQVRLEREKKKQEEDEQAKKAKIDDLWASFKSDTEHVRAKPTSSSTSTKGVSSKAESTSIPKAKQTTPATTKPSTSKVTITKTFDFAGEAVTVTKTVDSSSEEAKKAQKQAELKKQTAPSTSAHGIGLPSVKRKGGLGSVLGQIGKKPKMSTLEKSKLDWESFKSETGIAEDLKNYNKNGYLERQDFLQRTDERQFEREKEVRAAMRKQ